MSTRGRAGKFSKPRRGGGKHFSRDLRPVDAEGAEKSMWAEPSSGDDDSDDSSEEESSSEEELTSRPAQQEADMTREQRRALQKARKEAAIAKKNKNIQPGDLPSSSSEESEDEDDADMPANPNHTAKARSMAAKAATDPEAAQKVTKKPADASQMSRREKEAFQAQQAKERYQKLHAAGKTDEARADLERLKLVKQRREEETARKEAEKQEKLEQDKSKSEQLAREERQRALAAGQPRKQKGKKK